MKKRFRPILLILGAVVAVLFACLLNAHKIDETGTTPPETKTSDKTHRTQRVSNVETYRKLRETSREAARRLPTPTEVSEREESEAPPQPTTPEEAVKLKLMMAATGPHFFDMAPGTLDEILQEERRNEQWTIARRENILKELASKNLDGSTLEDIECRETMCRIRFVHENNDARDSFSRSPMMSGDLVAPAVTFGEAQPDGSSKSVTYIGRYGEDFKMDTALQERLYEKVTGRSADTVVPTPHQIEQEIAYRTGTVE